MRAVEKRHAADEHLLRGQELFNRGDYAGALRENQAVLDSFDKETPGDKALFSMGLIFAHPDNPGRDDKKSLEFFTRLLDDYPQSALAAQAIIWVHMLATLAKEKLASREPEKKIKTEKKPESKEQALCRHLLNGQERLLKGDYQEALRENEKALSLADKKASGGDKALFTMGLAYVHYQNPERDYRKSLECFARLVAEYPQSPLVEQAQIWMNMLDIIEKEKQVDFEIEQKKKDLERQEQR
jgi:tetratricopeptide (TPR) repeat protein